MVGDPISHFTNINYDCIIFLEWFDIVLSLQSRGSRDTTSKTQQIPKIHVQYGENISLLIVQGKVEERETVEMNQYFKNKTH